MSGYNNCFAIIFVACVDLIIRKGHRIYRHSATNTMLILLLYAHGYKNTGMYTYIIASSMHLTCRRLGGGAGSVW